MRRASGETSLWIRRFHPSGESGQARPRARLVCLPHAGGSASYFFAASAALSPEIEVLAVQYPGRQDRRAEPCIDDIPELGGHVARELLAFSDLPLVLFGHSMGASVAFEAARRLPSAGVEPLGVIASSRAAPSCRYVPDIDPNDDAAILAELRELSGTDAQVLGDEELLRLFLPALRADYTAVRNYRAAPGARVRCPVVAMLGDADPQVTVEEARAWAGHTDAGFELRVFPGGHFYLNDVTDEVLAAIRGYVERWAGADTVAARR